MVAGGLEGQGCQVNLEVQEKQSFQVVLVALGALVSHSVQVVLRHLADQGVRLLPVDPEDP